MELMGIICLPKAAAWCHRGCCGEEKRGHVPCPRWFLDSQPDPPAPQTAPSCLFLSAAPSLVAAFAIRPELSFTDFVSGQTFHT